MKVAIYTIFATGFSDRVDLPWNDAVRIDVTKKQFARWKRLQKQTDMLQRELGRAIQKEGER